MSPLFVKTCLQRTNVMRKIQIVERLRYVLSFCEDMSSKDKCYESDSNHLRGYIMFSPFVKTCVQRISFRSSRQIRK